MGITSEKEKLNEMLLPRTRRQFYNFPAEHGGPFAKKSGDCFQDPIFANGEIIKPT